MLAARMYGFVLERRWVIGLLFVLAVAAGCIRLGFWQLDRLQESRRTQRTSAERQSMPVEPLEAGRPPGDAGQRRVQASGRYDPAHEVVLAARSHKGRLGRHLLTPLLLDDGTAVIVDRGWIPEDADPSVAPATADRAVVTGVLLPPEPRGMLTGAPDLSSHRTLVRIDLGAIRGSVPYPVYPLWLLLEQQDPAPGDLPVPSALPKPETPPHLSYSIQWFLFATTALVGYAALARREAKERSQGERGAAEEAEAGGAAAAGDEEDLPAVPR